MPPTIAVLQGVQPDGQHKVTPEVATAASQGKGARHRRWALLAVSLLAAAASCTALVLALLSIRDSHLRPMKALDSSTRSSLEAFLKVDTDGDGLLNYTELATFRKELSGASTGTSASEPDGDTSPWPQSATDPVAEYLLLADTDFSGGIDFGEFTSTGMDKSRGVASCPGSRNVSSSEDGRPPGRRLLDQPPGGVDLELEQSMLQMWDGGFDGNGNGKLDSAELEMLLGAQKEADAKYAVTQLLEELDGDADGQLSEEEISRRWTRERAARATGDGAGATRGVEGRGLSEACNGHVSLCGKRLEEVAFATTHNSYNNVKDGYWYANQYETMLTQLEDGVRGFMIDLHVKDGVVYLCHGGEVDLLGFCPLGKEPAAEALKPMAAWLKGHPGEVVVFIVELGRGSARPSAGQLSATWVASELDSIGYRPVADRWPTLGEMVSSNTRAVLILPHDGWICGSTWSYQDRSSIGIRVHEDSVECGSSCSALRTPDCRGQLHVMNHFITYPATREYAKQINFRAVLSARVGRWVADHGRIPNFVAVDYYEIGNLLQVVDDLNGVPERPWACRSVGKTDLTRRFCCPSGTWLTSCGMLGRCDKASGRCRCDEDWERGFDCSRRVCREGSKCSRWSFGCWNAVPGCCAWRSFTWWC